MSKRLQVLLPEKEFTELRRLARNEGIAVGEWVRRALRGARREKPARTAAEKLRAVREAAALNFPTADLDQMLAEIERGYRG